MGQWLHQTKGGGDLLALQFEGGRREGERFVFKWGLEVGEMDGVSLHTTERERERSVFD